ncbi:hypothetical protein LX15_004946 [Streptoalloteichus tenebrarius]|uniref:Uncharacterized protein n=1 Tax=Streptoalloteichus tenebrarius (strain ATCC 17920 / DSM 40477 / JCM 4838 / CBS 697.72 / NBRC 16177 / NCIMB 11028 / NRRL B-12390 / A12253. 1 / ISP 5477) TaxID=1933 RepID=A0ABT1I0E6_STRSD|nr:DUF4383 domain-containing protein [Streptoalloteichus tenebrarius]MCP2261225.1 hypothetical protein [Streptoalloteichus tenebrarius]BFF04417.1 hypothetical protein GCM10020241_60920 [Streptoalloteichus tenebrarius]
MRMAPYLPPEHPLSKVYRFGGWLFGAKLVGFGGTGLVLTHHDGMFHHSPSPAVAAGIVLLGVVLLGASTLGGATASTVEALVGALLVLACLCALLVLGVWHRVALPLPRLCLCLTTGLALLTLGCYGRLSGGLWPSNPFARARRGEHPDHTPDLDAIHRRIAELDDLVRAEIAMAEGHPTPDQELLLMAHNPAAARARRHHPTP